LLLLASAACGKDSTGPGQVLATITIMPANVSVALRAGRALKRPKECAQGALGIMLAAV
jgi:hypothetical protein